MSDIEVDGKTLGQLAFEAYCEAVGGQTFDGKPIPGWNELHGDRVRVQGGWEAAAGEVARWVRGGSIVDEALSGPLVDMRPQKSRWQPVGAMIDRGEIVPLYGADAELLPQVDAERAAGARERAPVAADDSDGDELPLRVVGADGQPEGDQAQRADE